MNILIVLIEVVLQIFSSWTIAYHFALATGSPAKLTYIPFLAILLLLIGLSWRRWKRTLWVSIGQWWFWPGIIGLALITGSFTLFTSRPDYDDFDYFHRGLAQLQHMDQPFILTDTTHRVSGQPPPFSTLHLITSYEPLLAMGAALLGVDPLSVYQNFSAFIAGIILPIVYVLLYRQFRLNQALALLATLCALLFLLLDGNLHRSFGNFSLVRLWQGKVILVAILIPLTLLLAYRFLSYPSLNKLSLAAMASICAVGLSGSGVFLIPILIFCVSLAYLFSYRFSYKRLKRVIILNLASFYPAAIVIGLVLGLIPRPVDTTVWNAIWPLNWWDNLALVIGDNPTLIRNLLILLGLPVVSLVSTAKFSRGGSNVELLGVEAWPASLAPSKSLVWPLKRFFVFLFIILCIIVANPISGWLWMRLIQPAAYWRVTYLFPLPWCSGLIVCSLRGFKANPSHWLRVGVAMCAILATINAYQFSVFSQLRFKAPWDYKFFPQEFAFTRSISERVQGRNLLGPESVVVVLGLINPSVKFEATRPVSTLHTFYNVNQPKEGSRRLAAQELITTCKRSPENEAALLQSLELGVNAIVMQDCGELLLTLSNSLDKVMPGKWQEVERNNGYVLFLRHK